MRKINLKINNRSQKYPIIIGSSIISNFSKFLKSHNLNTVRYLVKNYT